MSKQYHPLPGAPPWTFGMGITPGSEETVSEERRSRQERIHEYDMRPISRGDIPNESKESLQILMKDLKEEGNALFGDKSYKEAYEFYQCSIGIAYHLQKEHYVDSDKHVMTVLFSNKAACCLKMDLYQEAVHYCEYALSFKRDNVKAYYRKASALKSLRQYKEALNTAMTGQVAAENSGKPNEEYVKNFRELIRELQSHTTGPNEQPSTARAKENGKNTNGQAKKTTSNQVLAATTNSTNNNEPLNKKKHVNQNSNANGGAQKSASVSAQSKVKPNNVDESWLEGTNALTSSPSRTHLKTDKTKSGKSKEAKPRQSLASNAAPKSSYQGRYSHLQEEFTSDSEEADSESDASEEELATNGHVAASYGASDARHSVSAMSNASSGNKSDINRLDGLDDFEDEQTNKLLGDFSPVHSTEPIPPPFISQYDFTLVCNQCYGYKGSGGPKGFIAKPRLQHSCTSNILLIRPQSGDEPWIKVRPRPQQKAEFMGKYRLCSQFSDGLYCRVAEDYCSFAHNVKEIELWDMDRNGRLNIAELIIDQRTKIMKGTSIRLYRNVQANRREILPEARPLPPKAAPIYTTYKPGPIGSNRPPRFQQTTNGPAAGASVSSNRLENHTPSPPPPLIRHLPNPYMQPPPPILRPEPTPVDMMGEPAVGIPFPLKHTHKYLLACSSCTKSHKAKEGVEKLHIAHSCSEDIFLVQPKGQGERLWDWVRERRNHRPFKGPYIMCKYASADTPQECPYSDNTCLFAHNRVEQELWTQEKDGIFSIAEFMMQCRTTSSRSGFTLDELLKKHPGGFIFLCRDCFFEKNMTNFESPSGLCSGNVHNWADNKQLMHVSTGGKITPIAPRPFVHKTAFFLMCNKMQYCARQLASMTSKRQGARCNFSHAMVEKDTWLLQRDTDVPPEQLVHESLAASQRMASSSQMISHPPVLSNRSTPSISSTSVASSGYATGTPLSISPPPRPQCPYKILGICGICWKNGKQSVRDGKHDRCNSKSPHSNWGSNKIFVIAENKQLLKPLPKKVPKGNRFLMCHHITTKKRCEHSTGGFCQFAHSEIEIEVWSYMVDYKLMTLDALVESIERSSESKAVKPIAKGESAVEVAQHAPPPLPQSRPTTVFKPMDLSMNGHYCQYCSVQCNSNKQWTEHCASEKHMFNINTDREHQWNYRQPRWNVPNGHYQLCRLHEKEQCRYSEMPDMFNACPFAHSQPELDEWKERYEFRQMKRDIARKDHVYSYMDTLLEEFEDTADGVNVICDDLEDVHIICDKTLSIFKEEKNASVDWMFVITILAGETLEKVSLLYDKDRLHFHLTDNEFEPCQITDGEMYKSFDIKGRPMYNVKVSFTGGIFGSFSQWIVFDFGSRPVVVRKLNVELGTQFVQEKVKKLRENLHFDRWTGDNREIIYFPHLTGEVDDNGELSKQYKPPSSADAVITQDSVGVDLNRHNYVHKMHKILNLEELTQARIISRLNLEGDMEVIKIIQERTHVFPRQGELFAKVKLHDDLSEDTDAGKLILSTVMRVLLAPKDATVVRVYEAIIVNKETFDFDGRGKDYIYLCLSPRCCHDLELMDGSKVPVEVQFQMERLPFCSMHCALDMIETNHLTGLVFPDVTQATPPWHNQQTLQIMSHQLNEDQMKIVQHVIAERKGLSLPLVVYGPFGTGKTETLAQSTMALLQHCENARILICTHSNSAADLYITKHLDEFITKTMPQAQMLRVYFRKRRINTVNVTVQKYCCFTPDHTSFAVPTLDDIKDKNLVITTLGTSLTLARQSALRGHFTHIFVDEAAQALECETIMPLGLATPATCIVLAGDHLQMTKKVYSDEAKSQRFNRSMLERLFYHYNNFKRHAEVGVMPSILLKTNYRTKMEILRFISAIFYDGPFSLKAYSGLPDVLGVGPLTFYVASGREVQDSDSTSYYNVAEVEEVTDRVEDLCRNWPPQWGPFNAEAIGVVTPYFDQVNRIRSSLRRRRRELKGVVVERLMNMQGKEFRVVIVSTVRTRHLLENPKLSSGNVDCDGDFGDFGFLSDKKLLNTAFTRAQSLVAVVGDPVALCAIGDCVHIWRAFLKHCTKMQSIHPLHVTLDTVRMQVMSLLNSPLGKNLIRITSAQREEQTNGAMGGGVDAFPNAADYRDAAATHNDVIALDPYHADDETARSIIEDWNLDYKIEADDIIKQLAKDEIKNQSAAGPRTQMPASDEPLKLECIHVKPEEGHAVMHYSTQPTFPKRTRRLLTGQDSAKSFDSDSDLSDDETTAGGKAVYSEFTPQALQEMVRVDPDKYKRCILHIDNSRRMYAQPIDTRDPVKEIKLSSRLRCGRGFNNDEVVVEILSLNDEEELEALPDSPKILPQGEVKGVLHRAINPKYRMFVCMVEQGNTGLMVPLNRGIPKIYNVENTFRFSKMRKGHVCVYTFTKDREIIFHHYEPIDPGDTTKLFVVRYLKWDAKFYSPLGVVVDVIAAGDTVERGMKILDIEHSIPKRFRPDTLAEVERNFPPNYTFSPASLRARTDLRTKEIFTIDPSESRDLDDALSLDMEDNTLVLGVHIADVAHYVQPGSALDREAESRGSSFYRLSQDAVPMLPERVSNDLCSLLPNKDKLAVSLLIKLDMAAEVLHYEVRKTIIRSKHRLDYDEAESIINQEPTCSTPGKVKVLVIFLYKVALMWREKRLGKFPSHYHPFDPECLTTPKAHLLVEEMMITANHLIAKYLLEVFPTCTPLRVQGEPSQAELQEWRAKFARIAHNSVGLTGPFLPRTVKCQCKQQCHCVNQAFQNIAPPLGHITVQKEVWDQIQQWVLPGEGRDPDHSRAKAALLQIENHPQAAVALMALRQLQCRSRYESSLNLAEESQYHHSLSLQGYTHFTSPIRRYIDIIVHRMIESRLCNRELPFSRQEDVAGICSKATDVSVKVGKYDMAVRTLHLSSFMHQLPLVLNPVLQDFDDSGMNIRFPTLTALPPSCGRVSFNSLGPCEVPQINKELNTIGIHWQQRIYNVARTPIDAAEVLKYSMGRPIMLDPFRFVKHIPIQQWGKLLNGYVDNFADVITEGTREISMIPSLMLPNFSADATSEAKNLRHDDHHVDYAIELPGSSVVQAQVVTELHKGILSPALQLLSLTPSLDICLEHRKSPTRCFAGNVNNFAAKPYYKDVASYQKSWLPLIALEAAKGSISGDNSAIIHNVPIQWAEEKRINGDVYSGTLLLPIEFCRDRHIKFSCERVVDASVPEELTDNEIYSSASDLTFDFICVRYKSINPVAPSNILMMGKFGLQVKPVHWVGHCITTGVRMDKARRMLMIDLKLHQSSVAFPRELLHSDRTATIEWIPKGLTDRRVENAIKALDKSTGLAKAIATGKNTPPLDAVFVKNARTVGQSNPPLPNLPNPVQSAAIMAALSNSFTLIQGPPGTGKTVTGVRLAYLFTKINGELPSEAWKDGLCPQVLYCGPSNKSVDVVTNYLLKLPGRPKIVRVYSEMLEHKEFPLPLDISSPRRRTSSSDTGVDPNLKAASLHHLIRAPDGMFSKDIKEVDHRIKSSPTEITDDELQDYLSMIDRAQRIVLSQANVILCTCSASAARRIKRCNIKQVIIDEAGMCTEPETMLPIISCRADQVVLIGDHRQLRPIVLDDSSRNLGLERSLFERYADKAVMLQEQYRMHSAICAFPSQMFYDNKLLSCINEAKGASQLKFWPNGREKPIAFVHATGSEISQTVATGDGSMMSKSNPEEAMLAVRYATHLVRRFHVQPKDVVVLSQYRSQCAEIEKQLHQREEKQIAVSTVVASQGSEWDYVVLSTVRSLPKLEIEKNPTNGWRRRHLGFIMDEHQINVAITRAKKGIIILGNKYLLKCDPMWQKLLRHYEAQKKVVNANEFMTNKAK